MVVTTITTPNIRVLVILYDVIPLHPHCIPFQLPWCRRCRPWIRVMACAKSRSRASCQTPGPMAVADVDRCWVDSHQKYRSFC